jgi:hypothetical protein
MAVNNRFAVFIPTAAAWSAGESQEPFPGVDSLKSPSEPGIAVR